RTPSSEVQTVGPPGPENGSRLMVFAQKVLAPGPGIRPKATFDELVKSRNSIEFVIPAKAGIQLFQDVLDPGFRRGDAPRDFLRDHHL
ncbi:MAG: hypothetical protein NTX30_14820, partial [Deltaproteobacteria bacterium]|nr:hypothetical protein [Deltaproteobacteria bacterium]